MSDRDLSKMAEMGGIQSAVEDIGSKLLRLKSLLTVSDIEMPDGTDNAKFKEAMFLHLGKVEEAVEDASKPHAGDMFLNESQKKQLIDKLADITATLEQGDFAQGSVLTKFVELNNLYSSLGLNE